MHKNIKAKQTRPSSADRLIPVPRHSNATSLSVEKKKTFTTRVQHTDSEDAFAEALDLRIDSMLLGTMHNAVT